MFDFLGSLLDPSGFPPRWRCGAWSPGHGWLHVLSDLGVASAYVAIPAVLGYFIARRKDVPFRGIFVLFTAFILACSTTHLMEAAIFWWPAYRLAGLLKLVTAVVSWATVVALVRVAPALLAMRTPAELEREVAARRAAEAELAGANAELERRVRERTDELTRANAALGAERERFRATLSSIGDGVIATDPGGRVTFMNPVAEALTGWPAADAVGADLGAVFRIVDESTREPVENPAVRALREGAVVGLANHTALIARGGPECPIDDCAAPIRDAAGATTGAVLVFRDVSERHRAQAAVRDSEERYRRLFDANPQAMWVYDLETLRFLAVNDAAVARYGYARDEFLGLTIKDIRPAEDVPALLASVAAGATGLEAAGVWRHRLRDGRLIWAQISSHALAFAGRPAKLVLAQDVTDRLRAEAELRASEERFRAFMDNSPAAAWITDPDGRVEYLSAAYRRTFRLPPGEAVGRTVADLYPPEVADVYLRNVRAVAASGAAVAATEPGVRADGTAGEFLVYKFPVPGPGGARQVGGVAVEVTELRATERALRASQERLEMALAAGGMGTFDWDVTTGRVVWSRSHYELFGYPGDDPFPVEFRHFRDGVHPDDWERVEATVRAAMDARTTYALEHRVSRPDGTERWAAATGRFHYDSAGRPARMVGVIQDVTARRELERQLRQAQKLEAVGRLAGGVAHDFNNLLTVVNGCGELLLLDLPAGAPARPLVEDIVRAGERGAALTRQLLAFSRQQLLRAEVFDPSRVLPDTAKLLARLLGEDVALRTALDPAAGCVKADPGQVEQVLMNLAVNGRDAMPTGGTLTVETAPAVVTDADLGLSPDARPGRYVRLSVSDTGGGMPPDVQARLFEPFFTTKGQGKGTGLGLATVYGIVKQSGGFLTVRSAVGAGTTVAVYLPRHEPEPAGSRAPAAASPRAGGTETVLVVEDDDAVRALTVAVLERHGYRVQAAASGAAALAACDRLPAPPDVVLTDVVMPGMSGRELAGALTARYPRLRVVFLSGYTTDAVLRHGVEEERVAFLQKPYTPDGLTRLVRAVLDGNPLDAGSPPAAPG